MVTCFTVITVVYSGSHYGANCCAMVVFPWLPVSVLHIPTFTGEILACTSQIRISACWNGWSYGITCMASRSSSIAWPLCRFLWKSTNWLRRYNGAHTDTALWPRGPLSFYKDSCLKFISVPIVPTALYNYDHVSHRCNSALTMTLVYGCCLPNKDVTDRFTHIGPWAILFSLLSGNKHEDVDTVAESKHRFHY
jgi:hypothetical protein